ncbi:MAG TPA: hypothetical protein VG963_04260, partial [Polyangiaceae bacterium]|nr:hypothetical protein [Polyangiaceae bacterium]
SALLDPRAHGDSPGDPQPARANEPEEAEESIRLLSRALRSQLLRGIASDVASAIAHAAGTPLNVITGRAELIRQDPTNAAAHAARIEEQVRRLASGFRQLVDYLALAEAPSFEAPAARVAADVLDAVLPFAREQHVELALDVAALNALTVDRGHVLGVLSVLLEWGVEQTARTNAEPRQLRLVGTCTEDAIVFEFEVPGLEPLSGWRLEHFETRPGATPGGEAYRTLSLCGALARGQGSRLSTEAGENGQGVRVRLSCLPGACLPGACIPGAASSGVTT